LIERAKAMKAACDEYGVPFIVNDRVDVAIACDADGVHLGQSDMTCAEARQILGPNKWIGVSCREVSLARQASADDADYIGCGACFGTNSKGDAKVIGLDGVGKVIAVARELSLPVVAIGGVSLENAASVRATGADGIAVISAVANAADVKKAVHKLLH
jgi:thiamine-phosphate diphosphorylase